MKARITNIRELMQAADWLLLRPPLAFTACTLTAANPVSGGTLAISAGTAPKTASWQVLAEVTETGAASAVALRPLLKALQLANGHENVWIETTEDGMVLSYDDDSDSTMTHRHEIEFAGDEE